MTRGFDFRKATQILNFFARREGGVINKMKSLKLVWLADRLHLRKFARPILSDNYFALQHGPVASHTKSIAEDNDYYLGEREREYRNLYLSTIDTYTFSSLKEVNTKVFSDSDIEAMNIIFSEFGGFDQYLLRDISHLYPEWNKFEHHFNSGGVSRYPMRYLDFFNDPGNSNHKVFEMAPEQLKTVKEIFCENYAVSQ